MKQLLKNQFGFIPETPIIEATYVPRKLERFTAKKRYLHMSFIEL